MCTFSRPKVAHGAAHGLTISVKDRCSEPAHPSRLQAKIATIDVVPLGHLGRFSIIGRLWLGRPFWSILHGTDDGTGAVCALELDIREATFHDRALLADDGGADPS